jgi:hypothetical protein
MAQAVLSGERFRKMCATISSRNYQGHSDDRKRTRPCQVLSPYRIARNPKISAPPITPIQNLPLNATAPERKKKKPMMPPARKPQPNLMPFSAKSGCGPFY